MIEGIAQVLRSSLETLTRDWVFRRKLPLEFGSIPILVSPSAGLKYFFRPMNKIDEPLLRVARSHVRPGNVVWDIGANIGLFSFAASYKCGATGQVVCFEPDPWLVQVLRRSASRTTRECAPITVVPAAMAQSLSIEEFNVSKRSRARSALRGFGYEQSAGQLEKHAVVVLSADWMLQYFRAPDVIKIDVEGAELEVLKGAAGLLDKKKPILICEVGQERQQQVTKFLQERNYLLYDCDDSSQVRVQHKVAPWNTLAIPKSPAQLTSNANNSDSTEH